MKRKVHHASVAWLLPFVPPDVTHLHWRVMLLVAGTHVKLRLFALKLCSHEAEGSSCVFCMAFAFVSLHITHSYWCVILQVAGTRETQEYVLLRFFRNRERNCRTLTGLHVENIGKPNRE